MAQLVGHRLAQRKAAGPVLVRACAWVAGLGLAPHWGAYERQLIDVCLASVFLSLSLSLLSPL